MKQVPFDAFACPLDALVLHRQGNSMICAQNHCFDFDRKGTLHLLPVQFKKSLRPGDDRAMVLARQRFLSAGHYQPLAEILNTLVTQHVALCDWHYTVLDAGCGEGYYTAQLATHLQALDYEQGFALAGMDISKDAIATASGRNRAISWLVATNAKIPVSENSIDCVISLFGFPVWPEFHRVLNASGLVIVAEAGPDHLIELRRLLYPEIRNKSANDTVPEGFSIVQNHKLTRVIPAPAAAQIADLIAMTPHAHRATAANIDKAIQAEFSGLTLDVVFKVLANTNDIKPILKNAL